jgi:hypothetical protein
MNTCFAVATTWIPPGGGLYSSANDLLKFISANIGLIRTKLDSGMGADVELHPVMSFDLKKGIPQAIVEVNSYRY